MSKKFLTGFLATCVWAACQTFVFAQAPNNDANTKLTELTNILKKPGIDFSQLKVKIMILEAEIFKVKYKGKNKKEDNTLIVDDTIKLLVDRIKSYPPDFSKLENLLALERALTAEGPMKVREILEVLNATKEEIRKNQKLDKAKNSIEEMVAELKKQKAIKEPVPPKPTRKELFIKLAKDVTEINEPKSTKVQTDSKLEIDLLLPDPKDQEVRAEAVKLTNLIGEILLRDVSAAPQHFEMHLDQAGALMDAKDFLSEARRRLIREELLKKDKDSQVAKKTTETVAEIQKLREQETFVHIVLATAGDLSAPRSRYQCNATKPLRNHCRGNDQKNTCTPSLNFGQLCGVDPYPPTYDRNRGLHVHYACISRTPENLRKTSKSPTRHPVTLTPLNSRNLRQITLKTQGQTINCPVPDISEQEASLPEALQKIQ